MLTNPIRQICRRQSIKSMKMIVSANGSRMFFTRHVPEPKMQIHFPKFQEDLGFDGKQTESVETLVLPTPAHDERKAVVLILGWAGANPKHIEKYVKFYNDEGYRVVSLCPPCYHYSIPNSRVGFYISPLFRAIDAKPGDFRSFKHCPIIIHSFSMNGVRGIISFYKWTEAEEKPYLRERIKGVIIDSAPSRPYGKHDATAMVISTPPIDALERWISDKTRISVLTAFLNLRATLQYPLIALVPFFRSFFSIYYYFQNNIKLPKDQLYLYSTGDTMIKSKHVEKFIENQIEKGNNVKAINFGESEHVAHIRTDPDKYRKACLEFVEAVDKKHQNLMK